MYYFHLENPSTVSTIKGVNIFTVSIITLYNIFEAIRLSGIEVASALSESALCIFSWLARAMKGVFLTAAISSVSYLLSCASVALLWFFFSATW